MFLFKECFDFNEKEEFEGEGEEEEDGGVNEEALMNGEEKTNFDAGIDDIDELRDGTPTSVSPVVDGGDRDRERTIDSAILVLMTFVSIRLGIDVNVDNVGEL